MINVLSNFLWDKVIFTIRTKWWCGCKESDEQILDMYGYNTMYNEKMYDASINIELANESESVCYLF